MAKITCVGCGALGSQLVSALMKAGHAVTIVDVDSSTAAPYVTQGAQYVSSLEHAPAESACILLCLPDSSVVKSVVSACPAGLLKDKIIVNTTYVALAEVADLQACVEQTGARYLDAAVISHARDLGTDDGYVVYSGNKAAFEQIQDILSAFSQPRFASENIIGAKLLNYTATGVQSIFELSFLDGLALCAKYGYPAEEYVFHVQKAMPPLAEAAHRNTFLCFATGEDYGHYDDNIHAMEQLVDLVQKSDAVKELTPERQKQIHADLLAHWTSVMESYKLN